MKTGVIDVGGGMRGIYAAGVFDYFMDKGIKFDVGIGVKCESVLLRRASKGQKLRLLHAVCVQKAVHEP